MKLNDEIQIKAAREQVFRALQDPETLKATIPGCEELEAESDTDFNAVIAAKVGPLKARFKGKAKLENIDAPSGFSLTGEGRGGPAGHAKAQAHIKLEESDGGTLLIYEVNADVGGKLAQLGGALVQNTAKKLAGQFFTNLEHALAGEDKTDASADAASVDSESAVAPGFPWMWIAAGAVILALVAWAAM